MTKAITGPLRVQPVREGKFELRDKTDMVAAKCDHEDHAKALVKGYNESLAFGEAWYKSKTT